MVVYSAKDLRRIFTQFMESKGHLPMNTSSVVPPKDDSSLLFVNSGMVQFKKYFVDSSLTPPSDKVCTVQRCIRAGGKHNDLDDVGKDNYHHTFFEMCGNWSFGAYSKKDAIRYAYEFLVDELKISKDRLYVTVYDEMDKESRVIWREYFDEGRIISSGKKDNFWEMGKYGTCGPCTEIHYDRIGSRDASNLVNADDPNVIEIWNIVFTEYERIPLTTFTSNRNSCIIDNSCTNDTCIDDAESTNKNKIDKVCSKEGEDENSKLVKLERMCVDTGIGLERLLSILNGKMSNYQLDSFLCIISYLESQCKYKFGDRDDVVTDVAFRVVADHSRTIAVCLNDNVRFGPEGISYVLRRILRRATRYLSEVLEVKKPGVLREAVRIGAEESVNILGGLTEEMYRLVDEEEELFMRTLKKGMGMFDKLVRQNNKLLSEDVFLLKDTFGFPPDLTMLIANEQQVEVDTSRLDELFEEARAKSREGSKFDSQTFTKFDFTPTDDSWKYESNSIEAQLLGVVVDGSRLASTVEKGQEVELVFDKTCFYAEAGGQAADKGTIKMCLLNGCTGLIEITDVQKRNGVVYHKGVSSDGFVQKEVMKCELIYDEEIRQLLMANHSSIHILGHLLREINSRINNDSTGLDEHKGIIDYTYYKLSDTEIEWLETRMNELIKKGMKRTIVMYDTLEELKQDKDVRSMDDNDYPTPIRVVKFESEDKKTVMMDACGGTHLPDIKEMKKFCIVGEASKKMGVRRLTLCTGDAAIEIEKRGEEIKKLLEEGVDVNFEKEKLRYVVKKRLTELRKNLLAQKKKESERRVSELIDGLKELKELSVKNVLSGEKERILVKELCGIEDPKYVPKGMMKVGNSLKAQKRNGFVYSKLPQQQQKQQEDDDDDEYYLVMNLCEESDELVDLQELISKHKKLKQVGSLVWGVVKSEGFNQLFGAVNKLNK